MLTFRKTRVRYLQLMGPEGIRLATYQLQLTKRVPVYIPSGAEHGATGDAMRKRDPDLLTTIKTGAIFSSF